MNLKRKCEYKVKKIGKNIRYTIYTIGISVIVQLISSILFARLNQVNFLTAFKGVWRLFLNFIKKVLLFNIQIWQILLFIAILFLINYILQNTKKVALSEPEFMKYTSDKYKGINYKWKLDHYAGEIKITHLEPICDCGAFLTLKDRVNNTYYGRDQLYCVNCEKLVKETYDYEIKQDALLFFINKLNKKIVEHNKGKA